MTVPALNIILAFEMLFTGKTIADSIVLSITATAGVVLSTIAMYYVDKFRNDGKVGRLKLQIAAQSGNLLCPLGKNIHSLLDSHFIKAQRVLEEYLASVKLSDLLEELRTQHLC